MLSDEQRKLVEDNMRLVTHIIKKKIHIGYDDFDDLFQEGCYYLCKAALDFNPDLGFQFSTYAGSLIWGGITRYKRDQSFLRHGIRVSRSLIDIDHKVKKAVYKYGLDTESKEDMDYILECIGVDSYKPLETVSMQTDIYDKDGGIGTCLGDLIPDEFKGYEQVELKLYVEDLLKLFKSHLGEKSYSIIIWIMHNYLNYGDTFTQSEIASTWNTSQAQISRILKKCKQIIQENS